MADELVAFSYLVASTLLGVIVGGLLQYYVAKSQDERRFKREDAKKLELDKRRKMSAYRQLKGHIDRIVAMTQGTTQRSIRSDQLEAMDSIISQNFDVLDESTRGAWDTKSITYASTQPWVTVTFEAFIADLNDHYEGLRYRAIPPKS